MYQAAQNRYQVIPYRRCGASGLMLPAVSLGLWHNFGDTAPYENMRALCEEMDATVCSTNVARGFIGPYVGMYASSNGEVSKRKATFSWFEYAGF